MVAEQQAAWSLPGEGVRYASWGRRFGAIAFDGLIILGVFTVIGIALRIATGTWGEEEQGPEVLIGIAAIPLWPLYFAWFHSRESGQTIGKRVAGIAVREEHGARLSFGRALGRAYLMLVLSFTLYIGLILDALWPLWDKRKQALHDKAVGSIVVRT